MHSQEHDRIEGDPLRPKAARLDPASLQHSVGAAQSARWDALTPDRVLDLQRSAGNAGTAGLLEEEWSPVHDVVATPGESLAPDVREDMESRLGHDFGDVRVHTDGAADASARGVNAHAYTVGSHVVFQRSAFDPGSHAGRTTLAHELTHVVQQRSGPVEGTPAGGGISVSDPSDRFEREASAAAEQAMAAPVPVQRDEDPIPLPTIGDYTMQPPIPVTSTDDSIDTHENHERANQRAEDERGYSAKPDYLHPKPHGKPTDPKDWDDLTKWSGHRKPGDAGADRAPVPPLLPSQLPPAEQPQPGDYPLDPVIEPDDAAYA